MSLNRDDDHYVSLKKNVLYIKYNKNKITKLDKYEIDILFLIDHNKIQK